MTTNAKNYIKYTQKTKYKV